MKHADLKNFGINILAARRKKGMSQEKLAELIDKSTNYISSIETGKANITVKIIVALSEVLGLEVSTLFKNM